MVREALARRRPGARRRLLVSNLPYSSGSVVLAAEARSGSPPDLSVVMVQKEVAERLAAETGSPAYGPLAVLHALRGEVRVVREVTGGVFVPGTKVASAIVELRRRPADRGDILVADRASRACFLHRRKTVRRALLLADHSVRAVDDALAAAEIDPAIRPERLSPQSFVELGRSLYV